MTSDGLHGNWQRVKARVAAAVMQDVPHELAACQVCNRHHCPSEQWLKCERRLAAQRYLEAGDRAAIEQLRQTATPCSAECSQARP